MSTSRRNEDWEELARNSLKRCTKCLEVKLFNDFYPQKECRGGVSSICKVCSNKDCLKRYNSKKDYYSKQRKETYYKRVYGISNERIKEMLDIQQDCCAICNKNKRLVVDHCHSTGRVRQLLCNPCNQMIGSAYEDINILKNAIDYLEKHKILLDNNP